MTMQIRFTGGFLLVAAMLATAGWFLQAVWRQAPRQQVTVAATALGVPVVMRTAGGLLEVSTLRVTERFTRSDTRHFWGLDLGTTTSTIQAPVVYRYHVELAREWRHVRQGQVLIVHAPALRPSVPVAFDSSAVEKYTASGWARFNKQQNLLALEQSMTPTLNARAASPHYLQLATEAARTTVREFVHQWWQRERGADTLTPTQINVRFPGERAGALH